MSVFHGDVGENGLAGFTAPVVTGGAGRVVVVVGPVVVVVVGPVAVVIGPVVVVAEPFVVVVDEVEVGPVVVGLIVVVVAKVVGGSSVVSGGCTELVTREVLDALEVLAAEEAEDEDDAEADDADEVAPVVAWEEALCCDEPCVADAVAPDARRPGDPVVVDPADDDFTLPGVAAAVEFAPPRLAGVPGVDAGDRPTVVGSSMPGAEADRTLVPLEWVVGHSPTMAATVAATNGAFQPPTNYGIEEPLVRATAPVQGTDDLPSLAPTAPPRGSTQVEFVCRQSGCRVGVTHRGFGGTIARQRRGSATSLRLVPGASAGRW